MIAVGDYHACALTLEGALHCWGANCTAELGVGDYVERAAPVAVGTGQIWRRVAAATGHTCALDEQGMTWSWGGNGCCATLGTGDYEDRLVPARIPVPGAAALIATGTYATHAVSSTGDRWSWGDNRNSGDLELGSDEGPIGYPTPGLGPGWTAVDGGATHGCGLREDRSLWCWGVNAGGPLGTGDEVDRYSPTLVAAGTGFVAAAAGYGHSRAIRDDGALACWGSTRDGALGDGMLTNTRFLPQGIGDGTWRHVSAGNDATCAIDTTDALWCWGRNDVGQLGLGDLVNRAVPTEVAPGTRWLAVQTSTAGVFTCGLQLDGSAWCWGDGAELQLGTGNLSPALIPTRVPLTP